MPVGRVKWFDNRKGWGFVIQPDGSDLFVHYTSILGDGFRRLEDGEEVEYEPVEGPKGPQAGNVRPLHRPEPAPGDGEGAPGAASSGDGNGEDEDSDDDGEGESPRTTDSATEAMLPQ